MFWLLLVWACSVDSPALVEPPSTAATPAAAARPLLPEPEPEPRYAAPVYAATHLLLRFGDDGPRSRAEARAEATALHQRAARGESLEALAKAHSEGPSGGRGGGLGVFRAGVMEPAFERALASVEPGHLAPLVETSYGIHVLRRDEVERVHVAQLVIGHTEARQGRSERSRDEALAVVAQAREALLAGTPFAEVATMWSEGPEAAQGGDLGMVTRGALIPALEEAAFALAPGETSGPIESPWGVHLVTRIE